MQLGVITNLGLLEILGAATLLDDTLINTSHTVQVDASQTLTLDGDFRIYRIHGRRASDMKGALAVMIELWNRLEKPALPIELVEIFYDREEGPIAENGLLPLLEKRPDLRKASLALCLEPTDLALQIGCCGSMHATLTFHGKSAHSALPPRIKTAVCKRTARTAGA